MCCDSALLVSVCLHISLYDGLNDPFADMTSHDILHGSIPMDEEPLNPPQPPPDSWTPHCFNHATMGLRRLVNSWGDVANLNGELVGLLVHSESQVVFDGPVHRDMDVGVSYVYGYSPFLAPSGCWNGRLGFHFEVRHHQVLVQCRQINDWMQIPCLLRHPKRPAVDASFRTLSMAPLDSRAYMACWRSWWLFLVRNAMRWWVSWGCCWKLRPPPPFLNCVGVPAGAQQASPLVGAACQVSPHLYPVNAGLLLEPGWLQESCDGGTHWDGSSLPCWCWHERTACLAW